MLKIQMMRRMNMKITMLGTGNALVSEVYNTCYVLTDEEKQGTEKYFCL